MRRNSTCRFLSAFARIRRIRDRVAETGLLRQGRHRAQLAPDTNNIKMSIVTAAGKAGPPSWAQQPQHHKCHVLWGVPDFVGKFHLNRMNTTTPIPGTAIRVEQERNALIEKRASSLQEALDDIEARRRFRAASRTRKAAITARVEVQATVGYRMDAGV